MPEVKSLLKRNRLFAGSNVNIVVFLTWLVVMPIIIFEELNLFAAWAVAVLFGLVLLGMAALLVYSRKSGAWRDLSYDERTDRFLMKSSRNGFLMAVLMTAVLAASAWILRSSFDTLTLLIWIWCAVAFTYMLSYVYYVSAG